METNGLSSEFNVAFPPGVKLASPLFATYAEDAEHPDAADHLEKLRDNARKESLRWRPVKQHSRAHSTDFARDVIGRLLERASAARPSLSFLSPDDREWVLDNIRLLRTALREVVESRRSFSEQPHVESWDGRVLPRPCVLAGTFLRAVDFHFDAEALASDLAGWQQHHRIGMGELWALKPALQLSILDEIAATIAPLLEETALSLHVVSTRASVPLGRLITTLRLIGETDWKVLFEQISTVDQILRRDPAQAYARMDYESRDLYRSVIAELASHSGRDETEIVELVLSLAESASKHETSDPRVLERETHVGYYLLDDGLPHLRRQIGYHAPLVQRFRELLLRFPNSFYLVGIEIFTFIIVTLVLGGLPHLAPIVAGFFFLFIPASQTAVELMNAIVTSWLPARRLPKLDFSEGIPDQYKTMVAVPSLLLNEEQVNDLVHRLEVRYLANRHPNLFFALVTDGPDSNQRFDEKEALTECCSHLIRDLNHKYAGSDNGPFFLFHRHRTFNPRENVWMGWERKRGKLLELNNLLRGAGDSFPVKIGDLSVLPHICFVITLDSDTQLPRDVAHRLIGTLAHPLNRAIVDPVTNTVTNGYGILQPRIGISVHSAIRSRLASIYSGQTGFDIYTRAVSDVYQDLYREGIFTGKGIYEVDVFRQVLEHRFPCNALLSHDLIEGAYARAALASDIELIDDYPSHFSAYSRRKHRWVRGDWQIMQWLSPRVPDFDGRMVPNPTTVVSRWRIFDNLRRSLVEPGLFFLLLAGWLFLPGPPWYWTLAAISLLLLPTYGQAIMSLLRISNLRRPGMARRSTGSAFANGHLSVLLTFVFLMHQTLVMMDAIVRTLIRHRITRRRLLEWETAAEAENLVKRQTVDIYLAWTPWIAL
ncbi:MAG: glycosyltransferase 36, partial [Bryobacterales bacterium]|nr:glycosyltransferase 36 [Bryobacterales bacterium]